MSLIVKPLPKEVNFKKHNDYKDYNFKYCSIIKWNQNTKKILVSFYNNLETDVNLKYIRDKSIFKYLIFGTKINIDIDTKKLEKFGILYAKNTVGSYRSTKKNFN